MLVIEGEESEVVRHTWCTAKDNLTLHSGRKRKTGSPEGNTEKDCGKGDGVLLW